MENSTEMENRGRDRGGLRRSEKGREGGGGGGADTQREKERVR